MRNGCGAVGIAGATQLALATEAQLNVTREVGLAVSGRAAHTECGGRLVRGHHVLDLAECTAGRDDRATHVAQDGRTTGGQGGRQPARRSHRATHQTAVRPCRRGERAAQHARVARRLRALVDLAAKITQIDKVANIVSHLLGTKGAHLLYPYFRNKFGAIRTLANF